MIKKVFPNGLTLLVRENPAVPLVTADLWFRQGSADEPEALRGVSHFLEHMVFKGTQRLAPGEYDQRIENLGGELNAATSNDFTHYYVTVPSRHFEEAFRDLAEVTTRPLLDPGEFEREKLVVIEEIRRKQDTPRAFLYEMAMENTYRSGGYKHPVLGYVEVLEPLTRDQMAAYHRAHYRPEKLTVAVAGDVKAADVIAIVERELGGWNPPPADEAAGPVSLPPGVNSREGAEYEWGLRREWHKDVREAYLLLVFPGPGLAPQEQEETLTADMVTHILGGTHASRLWQSVRERQRLVSSVSIGNFTLRGRSLTMVSATLEPQNTGAAIEAIYKEIERFARRGPTEEELQRARKAIGNHFLYDTETNQEQAFMSGYLFTQTGDTRFETEYLDRIRRVDAAAARKVARKWLQRETSNIFLVLPAGPAAGPEGSPAPAQ